MRQDSSWSYDPDVESVDDGSPDRLVRPWILWTVVVIVVVGLFVRLVVTDSILLPVTVVGAPIVGYYARDLGDELVTGFLVGGMGGVCYTVLALVLDVLPELGTAWSVVYLGSMVFYHAAVFGLGTAVGGAILGTIARATDLKWS